MKFSVNLKDFHHDRGRTQDEMFAPAPSTLSQKQGRPAVPHNPNHHKDSEYIAVATDLHTAVLHVDIKRNESAEPREEAGKAEGLEA